MAMLESVGRDPALAVVKIDYRSFIHAHTAFVLAHEIGHVLVC